MVVYRYYIKTIYIICVYIYIYIYIYIYLLYKFYINCVCVCAYVHSPGNVHRLEYNFLTGGLCVSYLPGVCRCQTSYCYPSGTCDYTGHVASPGTRCAPGLPLSPGNIKMTPDQAQAPLSRSCFPYFLCSTHH